MHRRPSPQQTKSGRSTRRPRRSRLRSPIHRRSHPCRSRALAPPEICMRIATSLLTLAVVAGIAHAGSSDAEILFQQGRKLMKKKAFAAACEKFDASERLEPAAGTELN